MTTTPHSPATAPPAPSATATLAACDQELAAYLAAHPAPAAAVDAVIRDQHGRLLVVDPVYKDGWDLPGGMVDDEGLVDGLVRELREELRPAALRVGRLLAVDNVPAPAYGRAMTACVYAVHLPHPLTVDDLHLQGDELRAAAFLPEHEALDLLPERLRRRTAAALTAERGAHTAHLLDGHPAPLDENDRWTLLPGPAVAAAAVVTDPAGRVLLVDGGTENGGAAAPYRLPGALVGAAETPEQAAARALAAEAGLAAPGAVGPLLAVGSAPCPAGNRTLLTHLFAAQQPPAGHTLPGGAHWADPATAPAALPAHQAGLLRDAVAPGTRAPGHRPR